jgi:hypothetical protein
MSDMHAQDTGEAFVFGDGSTAVSGNVTVNIDASGDADRQPPPPPPLPVKAIVALCISFVMVVAIVASCLPDPDPNPDPDPAKDYTENSGKPPGGASESAALTAVRGSLRNCAKAVVATPRNCPQSAPNAQDVVRWRMYGDPVDGAQIAWRDDHFNVRGNAIMLATYDDYRGKVVETVVAGFAGDVRWHDGKAVVHSIGATNTLSDTDVSKRAVGLELADVAPAIRRAFGACMKSNKIPMPPRCPNDPILPAVDDAKWSLVGDPLVHARTSFDRASGVLHVLGSFAAETTYDVLLFGTTNKTISGDFDAVVVAEGGGPVVLQIKKA